MSELQLQITVAIYQSNPAGSLRVSEDLFVQPGHFFELCKILAQFQELAQKFKPSP